MTDYFFSHARTALKYGLIVLDIQQGKKILIPDFICSVVLHPLEELGILPIYYPTLDDLSPNWNQLEKSIDIDTKAILMVHYFGKPQDISRFQNFCRKKELFLIEDNAHGHGGKFKGKLLGKFGDIGISSPSKSISAMHSGGILFLNNDNLQITDSFQLTEYKVSIKQIFIKLNSKRLPGLKPFFKKYLLTRPSFEDPYAFHEPKIGDFLMDSNSKDEFVSVNWDKVKADRYSAYLDWAFFAEKNDLQPVFKELKQGFSPLCFPAYAKNSEIAKYWFNWGWKHGYHVYSWPALPVEIIINNKNVVNRWERLICFSTNNSPKHL